MAKDSGQITKKADKRISLILEYLNDHEHITNAIAREVLGLSESATKRFLIGMVEANMIIASGERKARIYQRKSF